MTLPGHLRLAEPRPGIALRSITRLGGPGHDLAYGALLLVALGFAAAFAGTGLLRAIYPYPIDGLEPGALQEVQRVLAGQPLYVAPTLEYVPQIYGPVLFYLAAPLAALSGSAQFGLRATSLLASLGAIGLLVLLVRSETGRLGMGLFAGALLAACDQLVDGTMDVGRTDAVSLLCLLAATYATQQAAFQVRATWRRGAVAGCLMGLALLTKQSGLAVAVALALVLAIIRRRQLLAFVVAAALTCGAGLALLVVQSGSWPLFYLWQLPRAHQILPELAWRFWGDVLPHFAAPALLGPFYLAACLYRGDRPRLLFYTAVPLGLLGMAWASQATIRGGRNVELTAYAAIALLAGLGLNEALSWTGSASRRSRAVRSYLLAAAVGQLVVLLYNPRLLVPYRSDAWAGDRLATRLAALPGPIFAGSFQGYLRGVPGAVAPDLASVVELQGEQERPSTPEGDQWSKDLAAALIAGRFSYVVVDPDIDGFIVPQLATVYGYVDAGPLFGPDDVYWAWRTSWAPKAELYVRPDLVPHASP